MTPPAAQEPPPDDQERGPNLDLLMAAIARIEARWAEREKEAAKEAA